MIMESDMNLYLELSGTKRLVRSLTITLNVPPRAELQGVLANGESIQYESKFASDFMKEIPHHVIMKVFNHQSTHLGLCLYTNFNVEPRQRRAGISGSVSLQVLDESTDSVVCTGTLSVVSTQHSGSVLGYSGYEFLVHPWPEQAVKAKFTIPVYVQKRPQLQEERDFQLNPDSTAGKLDTKAFFVSDSFSDIKVICKGQEFSAHRLVLAGKSPVFEAMVSHPMKEADSGKIELNDDDPDVLTELFRFIYTGKVADGMMEDEDKVKDLYAVADKHNVEDLALLCEFKLVKNLKPENALVMYDLSQRRPESLLAKRSSEIIAKNRDKIAEDVESFRNFTNRYPDLIFEIFRR